METLLRQIQRWTEGQDPRGPKNCRGGADTGRDGGLMADCGVNDCPPNIPIRDKQRLRVYSFIWRVGNDLLELDRRHKQYDGLCHVVGGGVQ